MSIKSYWKTNKIWLIVAMMLSGIGILAFFQPSADDNLPDTVDFNYDIRPILSENCFTCHGPDSSSRKANLRLDTREAATAQLKSGNIAIVPYRPSKSSLLTRIDSDNPDLQMPPPEMNKRLSKREIALIKKWIKQGAQWKPYWAFIPPQMPQLSAEVAHSPPPEIIDFFIHQKLKEKQLVAAPKASKNALIRRLSFLLTGLPPNPEVVETFLKDTSENAYAKIVEQYLDSPHFGERWARHWMDLVRYGEHMGHEFDFPISGAWQYRDYLIRAFNQDVPYHQLVKEHLAGDMLPKPRVHPKENFNESIIGTGYLFLGEGKHSPVSLKGEELDRIDNMIDVTSKTFQGLTVACARCHDHKFDPIPTTDYYAMYGMLESTRIGPLPARMNVKNRSIIQRLDAIKQDIRTQIGSTLLNRLEGQSNTNITAQKRFIRSLSNQPLPKDSLNFKVIGDFRNGSWKGWYTDGWAFGKTPVQSQLIFDTLSYQAKYLEGGYASSQNYGTGIQGALHSPYFIIEDDSIAIKARGNRGSIRIIVDNFQIIQYPLWGGLEKVVNHSDWKTYVFDVSSLKGSKAYIVFRPGHYSNHQYQLSPEHYIDVQYAIAYDSTFTRPRHHSEPRLAKLPKSGQKELIEEWINGKISSHQLGHLNTLLKEENSKNNKITFPKLMAEYDSLAAQLHDPSHFLGAVEGDAVYSSVFIRGDKDHLSDEKVPHQFLSAIEKNNASFTQKGSGRLAWAKAVIAPDNPLTSRVMVNRIWHHLFGRGIVETVDNFGLQGKLPTHPDLLDYLSLYFMEEGWSIKNLIRQIVLSESFKRSTAALPDNILTDPDNTFLHHFPIRRLEAEAIRDAMLSVSGTLNPNMYGKPVEIHLTEFMTGRGRPYTSGPLDGDGRRSIYTTIRRNFLSPMMSVFDAPMPFSTFGKRNTTNVPAQSLTLMNDPFVYDQACNWAMSIVADPNSSFTERIQKIYQRAFSRKASSEEMQAAQQILNDLAVKHHSTYEALKDDPLIWTDYCHAIFNLKEFIYLL